MTSSVRLSRLYECAFALFLLLTVPASAETITKCARPPGEEVRCEDRQAAICKVEGRAVYGRCSTPPQNTTGLELSAWLLSRVLEQSVTPDEVAQGKYDVILQEKRWESENRIVTFTLPTQ
jgi:hypothetical protein